MKKIVTLLTALAFMATTLVATATPASAMGGCRAWKSWPIYAYAKCDYGFGGVRVVGDCWYPSGNYIERYWGPWVLATQTSGVICRGGSYISYAFYETF
jgi:hypothetical protein